MILRARDGLKGVITDLDTKEVVKHVIWLDTEAGRLEKYLTDSIGNYLYNPDGTQRTAIYRGRFSFTPKPTNTPSPVPLRKIVLGADKCAKCTSKLTLPGTELCAFCQARDRNQRWQPFKGDLVERFSNPLLDHKCSKCSRLAIYSVADEVEVTPQQHRKILWLRGATVGRRFLCQFHYEPPRLLDSKGEVISDLPTERRPD